MGYAWWEDQIMVADVAGGLTIREALSAYGSSLYQRSRRTPKEQEMAKKQLMRDLFRTLGKIDFKEPALADIYNEIPIARHKGGMILEQIEDIIGQEALLAAIREFLQQYRYQDRPYATVLDLRDAILAKANVEQRSIISELFTEVVTYQVGLVDAVSEKLPDGKYKVTLEVEGQKFYTSELGQQEATDLDLPVTISLIGENGESIYNRKHKIKGQKAAIELVTEEFPIYGKVDPNYVFPSAFLQDNMKRIRVLKTNKSEVIQTIGKK